MARQAVKILLDQDQAAWLREEAERQRRSQAEIVRRLVEVEMAHQGNGEGTCQPRAS